MRTHDIDADPAPAFTTEAEIAIADRLRHQLEERYLVPPVRPAPKLQAVPTGDRGRRDEADEARDQPLDSTRSKPAASRDHGSRARRSRLLSAFDRFSTAVTRRVGSPVAFCAALMVVIAWAIVGPMVHFSDSWQLVINTGTTIVTFLMVFLMQQSQSKDSVALHLKLDELIASSQGASNRMVDIEDLDEQELRAVAPYYAKLAARARTAGPRTEARSIDEQEMPSRCPPTASRRNHAMAANDQRQGAERRAAPGGTRRSSR